MTADFTKHRDIEKKWIRTGIAATLVMVLMIPLSFYRSLTERLSNAGLSAPGQPAFVGREKCRECHRNEYEKWKGSHHDKAMAEADESTVLGDFNNAEFVHEGVIFRFFKKDDKFFVHTMGPDGRYADFRITHTFGFTPLQQYLIPFDLGRLQCLTIAWDDEKKVWYALPNHTSNPEDWLHWSRQGQNWNGMCAECHSTGLKKGYDSKTNQFNTTWAEINVSCEACHGPGADHVAWASVPEMGRPRVENYNLPIKTRDLAPQDFFDICARCHSRRGFLGEFSHGSRNMLDYMIPSLLTDGLYYPDGQISDEVYVYGSFIQSKMFLRGVRCSDCHDVHSLELKARDNGLCLNCHRADIYDSKNHHFHKRIHEDKESKGDDCIQCHMPQRVYMGIDKRADHSIRIPRPDLSIALETPNACNAAGCHNDKTPEWAHKAMTQWYGIKKRAHFGETFAKAGKGNPKALPDLISLSKDRLFPGIVRATALSLLSFYPTRESYDALETALADPDPLIRQTAIATINLLQFDKDATLIFPLLYDPVRAVRIQAALAVASLQDLALSRDQKKVLDAGVKEYVAAMEYTSDFPSGRYNLGLIHHAMGNTDQAVDHYKQAILIDDLFLPAKNNLAMLYNARDDNEKAEALFRQILAHRPDMHDIAYSLGLLLIEQKKYSDALPYLEQASAGLPDHARIDYNLGILHQILNNQGRAEQAFLKALSLSPQNFDFLYALAGCYLNQGRIDQAMGTAEELAKFFPENATAHNLLRSIRAMKMPK